MSPQTKKALDRVMDLLSDSEVSELATLIAAGKVDLNQRLKEEDANRWPLSRVA